MQPHICLDLLIAEAASNNQSKQAIMLSQTSFLLDKLSEKFKKHEKRKLRSDDIMQFSRIIV
jgi:hypothetical protein